MSAFLGNLFLFRLGIDISTSPSFAGFIGSKNFYIVNPGIKHWSPSYTDLRIHFIPLRYLVVIRPCRDLLRWSDPFRISCGSQTLPGSLVAVRPCQDLLWWSDPAGIFVLVWPCRDNFKGGIKHVSSKVPTLDFEIKRSRCMILHTKFPTIYSTISTRYRNIERSRGPIYAI